MFANALLAALAAGLLLAAAWEAAGGREQQLVAAIRRAAAFVSGERVRSVAEAALWLRLPERLQRAGLEDRIAPRAVLAAKAAGAAAGAALGALAAPAAPARLGIAVALALPGAGFVAPDALLERAARRRRERLVTALPDALDLLATAAGSGRPPLQGLRDISAGSSGPLAAELARAVAEVECGRSQERAMAGLAARVPGVELGALAAAIERSRRYGSPLADQLREQAAGLRRDARRRIEERAARAAPKIQLVVALVLVPSVLLMILAAIVAHSDALFGAV
jgi:tight adherence protein C